MQEVVPSHKSGLRLNVQAGKIAANNTFSSTAMENHSEPAKFACRSVALFNASEHLLMQRVGPLVAEPDGIVASAGVTVTIPGADGPLPALCRANVASRAAWTSGFASRPKSWARRISPNRHLRLRCFATWDSWSWDPRRLRISSRPFPAGDRAVASRARAKSWNRHCRLLNRRIRTVGSVSQRRLQPEADGRRMARGAKFFIEREAPYEDPACVSCRSSGLWRILNVWHVPGQSLQHRGAFRVVSGGSRDPRVRRQVDSADRWLRKPEEPCPRRQGASGGRQRDPRQAGVAV